MRLAYAHPFHSALDHVHHVGGIDWLHDWTFDPTFLVPLLLALLYFRGVRRHRALGGKRFPPWRQACVAAAVLIAFIALDSPLDTLADWSFTAHMMQHELLMVLSVPIMLVGQPFLPVLWGTPEWFRKRAFVWLARRRAVRFTVKWATHPVTGLLAYWALVWIWHVPALYDAAYYNDGIHYAEHLSFVLGSGLFWWDIVSPFPFQARLNVFLRVMMIFLSEVPNIALSALITFSDTVLYAYAGLPGFWGLTMLQEQQVGGLLMWIAMGAMARLVAALLVLHGYVRVEEAKEPWNQP
ncbi:MAG TPA: cytochrome c oxidase assembly protein, partial [bacterium]|nr:cytochrome c oxidase assembly protein [bacterium]